MAEKKAKTTKTEKATKAEKPTKTEKVEKAEKVKSLTKSEVFQQLAEKTNLTKKQISEVFEALLALITRELGKKGPGQFTIPGVLKLKVKDKPATKATTRPNPFKPGEMMEVKAKPAKKVVSARPLKTLNEMI